MAFGFLSGIVPRNVSRGVEEFGEAIRRIAEVS
jgi:hypothetical protein